MERQPVEQNSNKPVQNTTKKDSLKDNANRQEFSRDQPGSIKAPGDQGGAYKEPLQSKEWKPH